MSLVKTLPNDEVIAGNICHIGSISRYGTNVKDNYEYTFTVRFTVPVPFEDRLLPLESYQRFPSMEAAEAARDECIEMMLRDYDEHELSEED